jgi:hypothetical protein
MKTTERKSNATALVIGAGIVLAILALVVFGLWTLASGASRETVNGWAAIATLLIVPVFLAGFYFGKTEARGVLAGFDKSLDRMAKVIGDVVTVRDQSRIAVHQATRQHQPGYTVVLPNVTQPTVTHRQLTSGDESEDL